MRKFLAIALTGSLFLSILLNAHSSYSYPTSIGQSYPAKWTYTNLTICISNIADKKYEELFVRAVEEWKGAWPHFNYILQKKSNCNINVSITKAYVELQKAGHAGITQTEYYENGSVVKADIIIPTQIKGEVRQGYYCCKEVFLDIPEKTFFVTALHEFGHALNLDHAVDDGKEPRDVMHPTVSEESQYVISAMAIKALDKIYGTKTEAADHPVSIKPSVDLEATMDKPDYAFDDTLKLSGKVSKIGGTGTVLLFDPSISLYAFTTFTPKKDGSYSADINLRTEYSGKWILAVQYLGASVFIQFDLKEMPYKAFGQTDKPTYTAGDLVKISGNVTRTADKVFLTVINPDGISFTSTIAKILPDKRFAAEFTLKESRYTIEGRWTIRLDYAGSATDIHFDLAKPVVATPIKVPEPPEPKEVKEEKKQDLITVNMKEKKKSTLLAVKNAGDIPVYSIKIKATDGKIKFVKAKGWDREKLDLSTVIIKTKDAPFSTGKSLLVMLIIDNRSAIEWTALDAERNVISSGMLTSE
jgi:hypothetical protein